LLAAELPRPWARPVGSPAGEPPPRTLIQASPSVVDNADWPDLPKDSGEGLLIYAGGPYHDYDQSAVRLAWAPLVPGELPPPPSKWLFLSDTTPRWQTLASLEQAVGRGDPNARPTKLVSCLT
jgi:hypothetical protein